MKVSYEWLGAHGSLTPGLGTQQVGTWGTRLDGMQPQPGPPLIPPQSEAVEMMDQIVHWVREDPSGLGRPQLPGAPAAESMAVPMMLLSLVEQLGEANDELAGSYAELGDWCARRILRHVQVGAGQRADGGRQTGPGELGGRGDPLRPTPRGASSARTHPRSRAPMAPFTDWGDGARCGPEPSGREGGPRGEPGWVPEPQARQGAGSPAGLNFVPGQPLQSLVGDDR